MMSYPVRVCINLLLLYLLDVVCYWVVLGRLYQVEYAMEAIGHAGTCLGILASDGIVLAAEKRNTNKLLDELSYSEKIYRLHEWVFYLFVHSLQALCKTAWSKQAVNKMSWWFWLLLVVIWACHLASVCHVIVNVSLSLSSSFTTSVLHQFTGYHNL